MLFRNVFQVNISFQKKLFLYFGVVITIIIIFFIVAFSFYSSNITRENLVSSSSQMLQKVVEQYDSLIVDMDRISFGILLDTNIKEFIIRNSTPGNSGLKTDNSIYIPPEDIRSVMNSIFILSYSNLNYNTILFNFDSRYAISLGSIDNAQNLFKNGLSNIPVFKKLAGSDGSLVILPPHFDNWSTTPKPVFSIGRKILNMNRKECGYIEVQLNYNYLKKIFSINTPVTHKFCVLNNKGDVLYPSIELEKVNYTSDIDIYKKQRFKDKSGYLVIVNSNKDKEMLFYCRSKVADFTILFTIPLKEIYSKIRSIVILLAGLGVLFLFTTLLILYFLSVSLTKPLKELKKSINFVSLDNLSTNISYAGSQNEIQLLNDTFNYMLSKLGLSIKQLGESKEREALAKFEALQSQINPHFIYNTLSTISATAKHPNETDKVVEMCRQLSYLLRYTSSFGSSYTTIKKEIDYSQNYLGLMEFRYSDQFSYNLTIPDELNDITIPKIILQPFLENCFKHAFSIVEPPWHIDIRGVRGTNYWTVTISDNGPGLSEHAFSNINSETMLSGEKNEVVEEKGLGIINTYNRLKLFWGEKLIFTIGNSPDKGLTITIGAYIDCQGV